MYLFEERGFVVEFDVFRVRLVLGQLGRGADLTERIVRLHEIIIKEIIGTRNGW